MAALSFPNVLGHNEKLKGQEHDVRCYGSRQLGRYLERGK